MAARSQSDTSKELKSLRSDLTDLREDVASLLSALKSDGKSKAGDAGSAVRERAHEISARLSEQSQRARECVEEHPFKTALATLGAGVLVGTLLGRNGH
jgi:ElaB/YqjD/DUF883 family membrane-anchored ribosome-binding protein